MRYCVKLMRAPVVNAEKNEKIGNIKACLVHPEARRVVGFLLEAADEGADIVTPFGEAARIYQNAVMIRSGCLPATVNDDAGKAMVLKTFSPLGLAAITRDGVDFGVVGDFAFDPESGDLSELILDDDQGVRRGVPIASVLRISRENIIVAPGKAEAKPAPPPAAEPPPAPPKPASSVAESPQSEPAPAAPSAPRVVKQQPSEARSEVRAILEDQFRDQLREGLREMTSILMERVNAIDSNKHFEKLKNDLAAALQPAASEEETRRLRELLAETVAAVDEKINASAEASREAVGADVRSLRDIMGAFAEVMGDNAKGLRADFEARVEKLEEAFRAKLDAAGEELSKRISERVEPALDGICREIGAEGERAQLRLSDAPRREEIESIAAGLRRLSERMDALDAVLQNKLEGIAESVSSAAGSVAVEGMRCETRLAFEEIRDSLDKTGSSIAEALQGRVDAVSLNVDALGRRADESLARLSSLSETFNGINAKVLGVESQGEKSAAALESLRPVIVDAVRTAAAPVEALTERIAAIEESLGLRTDRIFTALVDSRNALESALERTAASLGETVSGIEQKVGALDNGERIAAAVDTLKTEIAEKLAAASAPVNALNERVARMEETLRERSAEMSAALADIRGAMESAFERVGAPLKESLAGLEEKIGRLDGAPERFDEVADALKSEITEKISNAAAPLESFGARMGEFETALQDTRAGMSDMSAELQAAVRDGSELAFRSVEGLRGDMSELTESLSKSVGEWSETLRNAVRDTVDASFEGVAQRIAWIKVAAEAGRAVLEKKAAQLEETAANAAAAVTKLSEEMNAMRESAELRSGETREHLIQQLEERIGPAVEKAAGSVLGGAGEQAAERDEQNRRQLDGLRNDVVERVENIASRIEGLRQEWDGRLGAVTDAWRDREGAAARDMSGALDALRAAMEKSDSGAVSEVVETLRAEIRAVRDQAEKAAGMSEQFGALRERLQSISESTEGLKAGVRETIERELGARVESLSETLQQESADAARNIEAMAEKMRSAVERASSPADMDAFRRDIEDRVAAVVSNHARRMDASLQLQRAGIDEDLDLIRRGIEQLLKRNVFSDIEKAFSGQRDEGLGGLLRRIGGGRDAAPRLTPRTRQERDEQAQESVPGPAPVTRSRLQYLVGRKVQKDILDEDGACVVPAGSVVDEALIEQMRELDRVVDLVRSVDFNP